MAQEPVHFLEIMNFHGTKQKRLLPLPRPTPLGWSRVEQAPGVCAGQHQSIQDFQIQGRQA